MKHHFSLILFLFFLLSVPVAQTTEAVDTVPFSKTSRDAYKRIAPKIARSMRNMDSTLGDPVFIRIFKKEKQLEVWLKQGLSYVFFKSYSICHHSGDLGPKVREGDKQSPEGFYNVTPKQLNPNSNYHLSFNLGFPNKYDRSHKRTGSLLMIHGRCSSVGCFAMSDFRMDEIYTIVESAILSGQHQVPVHIFPFKMSRSNMVAHRNSEWIGFWKNLKEGYDYFEGHHSPPLVTVQDKRYHFKTISTRLFGGTLPPPVPHLQYVSMKKKFKIQEIQEVIASVAIPKKRQRLLLAKAKKTIPSVPALLGLGD